MHDHHATGPQLLSSSGSLKGREEAEDSEERLVECESGKRSRQGTWLDVEQDYSATPLVFAADFGHFEVVEVLGAGGTDKTKV